MKKYSTTLFKAMDVAAHVLFQNTLISKDICSNGRIQTRVLTGGILIYIPDQHIEIFAGVAHVNYGYSDNGPANRNAPIMFFKSITEKDFSQIQEET